MIQDNNIDKSAKLQTLSFCTLRAKSLSIIKYFSTFPAVDAILSCVLLSFWVLRRVRTLGAFLIRRGVGASGAVSILSTGRVFRIVGATRTLGALRTVSFRTFRVLRAVRTLCNSRAFSTYLL